MTYAELAEAQYRRSRQFAEAQTDVMSVYCDAERDLKELQAENAKLRDELAKLRVLVLDIFSYAFNRGIELCNACSCADGDFADCSACDEYDGACGIARKRFEELYADRMRELGIEVN